MEIEIEDLIKRLKAEQETGATKLVFKGTIYVPENGNAVIISTEIQY